MYKVMIDGVIQSEEYEDREEALEAANVIVDSKYIEPFNWYTYQWACGEFEEYQYVEPTYMIVEVED